MSTVRYHCDLCGFITHSKSYISKHTLTCKKTREDEIAKYTKRFKTQSEWFEDAINSNAVCDKELINKSYESLSKTIVTLFRLKLSEVNDDVLTTEILDKRRELQAKLDKQYTILTSKPLQAKQDIKVFSNSLIKKDMSYIDHGNLANPTAASTSSTVRINPVPDLVKPQMMTAADRIKASRRSVGSMLPQIRVG